MEAVVYKRRLLEEEHVTTLSQAFGVAYRLRLNAYATSAIVAI